MERGYSSFDAFSGLFTYFWGSFHGGYGRVWDEYSGYIDVVIYLKHIQFVLFVLEDGHTSICIFISSFLSSFPIRV